MSTAILSAIGRAAKCLFAASACAIFIAGLASGRHNAVEGPIHEDGVYWVQKEVGVSYMLWWFPICYAVIAPVLLVMLESNASLARMNDKEIVGNIALQSTILVLSFILMPVSYYMVPKVPCFGFYPDYLLLKRDERIKWQDLRMIEFRTTFESVDGGLPIIEREVRLIDQDGTAFGSIFEGPWRNLDTRFFITSLPENWVDAMKKHAPHVKAEHVTRTVSRKSYRRRRMGAYRKSGVEMATSIG